MDPNSKQMFYDDEGEAIVRQQLLDSYYEGTSDTNRNDQNNVNDVNNNSQNGVNNVNEDNNQNGVVDNNNNNIDNDNDVIN